MKVELNECTMNDIVGQSLRDTLSYLRESVTRRAEGKGIPYYDDDPIKDIQCIEEKIEAVESVLELYGLEFEYGKKKS
jgi:hypothetical protein